MSSLVDWLSFSLPVILDATTDEGYKVSIERAVEDGLGLDLTDRIFGGKWDLRTKGRAPYTEVWERKDAPILMFTSRTLSHMTVEFSGQGCAWLRDNQLLQPILEKVHKRVTRIDLATDIKTKTSPTAFVHAGVSKRFSSRGTNFSSSGETVYVGSPKSDRFARVYRYASPHPRADFLRIEHVLRREQAQAYAGQLLYRPVEAMAAVIGDNFGWEHADWSLRANADDAPSVVRGVRGNAGTIRWLMLQAAPAFKRLVAEGEIRDAEEFLKAVFLS